MPVEVYNIGTPKRSHLPLRDYLCGKIASSIILFTILVCAFLSLPRSSPAQDLPWRHVDGNSSRYGAEHPALIYDHSDPTGESWYTLLTGAAWHTPDLGVTMNPISQEGMDNQIWSGLAIAYDQPDILYATTGSRGYHLQETLRFPGNGVYRSSDKGRSWTSLPFFPGIEDLDDLRFLTNVITSSEGDTVIVATNKRILRSQDSGQSWEVVQVLEQVPNPITGVGTLEAMITVLHHHPATLSTIFATVRGYGGGPYGGSYHHYALISRDGGTAWERLVVDGWEVTLDREDADGIGLVGWQFAHDPTDPNIIWLHAKHPYHTIPDQRYGRKFYRTADGGDTWSDIPAFLKVGRDTTDFNADDTDYTGVHFQTHPMGGDTLVFGLSVGHYRDNGELLFDGKPTGVNPLLLPAPDTYLRFRWVRLGQINTPPGKQFAIMWEEEEYVPTYLWTGEFPNARVYTACKSPAPPFDPCDFGPPLGPWVYVVDHRDLIPANASGQTERADPGQASGRAFKNSPEPPGQLGNGVSGISTRNILCHPDRYDLLRGGISSWGTTRYLNVQRYTPTSVTHSSETAGPPVGGVLQLSASKQQPDQVWAATRDGAPSLTGIWRSNDYSDTWVMVHMDPLVETVHVHEADDQVVYSNRSVSRDGGETWEDKTMPEGAEIRSQDRLRSHSQDTSILYVCHSNGGLRKWSDYLQADTLIASSEDYGYCRDLFVFPDTPERMWLGADKGLFESLDGGESWTRQNRGLPNVPITRIVLAPDRSEILVGTLAYGLFVLDANEVDIVPAHRVSTEELAEHPESSALLTNYPNPFIGETSLQFRTEKPATVRLEMFDVLGRRVAIVTDQVYGSGMHQVRWSGTAMPSGVYFVRMEANGRQVGVQKLVRQ